jgi:hypothetical protein
MGIPCSQVPSLEQAAKKVKQPALVVVTQQLALVV